MSPPRAVRLWVPGHPRPMPRHRVGQGQAYQATTVMRGGVKYPAPWVLWRQLILRALVNRTGSWAPLTGSLELSLGFWFPLPAKPGDRRPGDRHVQKPDTDNLEKLVMDALHAPQLRQCARAPFGDDCTISDQPTRKRWTTPGREGMLLELCEVPLAAGEDSPGLEVVASTPGATRAPP